MLSEPREAHRRTSTFTVTAGQPRQLHLATAFTDKPDRLHTEAIYDLKGDTLTYCVAPPNRPRPEGFWTAEGDGNTLVVLKRLPLH